MRKKPSCFSSDSSDEEITETVKTATATANNTDSYDDNIFQYDEVYDEISSLPAKRSRPIQSSPKFAHSFMEKAQERRELHELIKQKQVSDSRSEKMGKISGEEPTLQLKFETAGYIESKNQIDPLKKNSQNADKYNENVKSLKTTNENQFDINFLIFNSPCGPEEEKYLKGQLKAIPSNYVDEYLKNVKYLTSSNISLSDIENAKAQFKLRCHQSK